MKGILGKKVGMTQIFDEIGNVVPVTLIEAGPCHVIQKKTEEKDGYSAVQLGFGEVSERRVNKPKTGHLKKASAPPLRYLREFRLRGHEELEVGQIVKADVFEPGDRVDVVGISKGKGFAGVVKRHGFAGGIKTHGQSDRHRAAGSIGAGTTPGHVFKGLRMPGRMGGERVTISNLEVVVVDPERNLLAVKGSIPGAKNGLVMVKEARKTKKRSNI
jgi:large subunit ribosomal protein L3